MNQTWTRFLPQLIRTRITGSQILQRIIGNSGWMFFDKVFRMGITFLVNVWVTRYLGPERFGQLSFAAAFVSLFTAVANVGLYGIVIRDIVRYPESRSEIIGTALVLKLIGGLACLAISVTAICFVRPGDSLMLTLVTINAAGMIFLAFDVFDFWFQSQLQSKNTVYANFPVAVLITGAKIILVLYRAPLVAFAWIALLEILLSSVGLLLVYHLSTGPLSSLRASVKWSKSLLKDSLPLIFAGLMLMVYSRIDQIMIGQMLGNKAVGEYSVAVKFSELWYFFPLLVLNSMFPAILEAKKCGDAAFYRARVQKVMNVMALIAYLFVVPLCLFSDTIIRLLYGQAYKGAGPVLAVYVLSGIFYLLGYTREYWVTSENITRFSLYSTGTGAVLNVLLNCYLIPSYGAIGAAYATLISIFVGGYLLNAFHRQTRPIFAIQTRSLFLVFAFGKDKS